MGEHNIQNTRSVLSPGHREVSTTVKHFMPKTPTLAPLVPIGRRPGEEEDGEVFLAKGRPVLSL